MIRYQMSSDSGEFDALQSLVNYFASLTMMWHPPKRGTFFVGGHLSLQETITYSTKRDKENHGLKSADWYGIC